MTFIWFALAAGYLAFIFWLGSWGDGRSRQAKKFSSHPLVYSFALAIYCTAWTYFGAVGEAARNQWNYLPILLGPILLYLFGYRLIIKLIEVSKKQHVTTIADLVSSRYGKRQNVALIVTLIVLLATIPYIALQLQAIGTAFSLVSGEKNTTLIVLTASLFLGVFCVIFGTQKTDVTEYRHGLMLSISFESVLKIAALTCIAVFALWSPTTETQLFSQQFLQTEAIENSFFKPAFWLQTLVAAIAVLCLPRQFHVAIIDNLNVKHVATARWVFPGYLALTAILIPIIATAGTHLFAGQQVTPDSYVIAIATESGNRFLQAMVFLGGLSAATAMIIVSTLTLSTMLSNDVILPKLLNKSERLHHRHSHIHFILWLRRGVIAGILLLSFSYHIFLSGNMSLSSIGLLAFSLVIQLSPALLGGLYWQRAHAHGVIAGLIAGIFTWILLLIFPLVNGTATSSLDSDTISITASIALAINSLFFVLFSLMARPNLMDKLQAQSFVSTQETPSLEHIPTTSAISNEDLITVLRTFLGSNRTNQLLSDFEQTQRQSIHPDDSPQQEFIVFCERSLGGVIGAPSSNLLINAVLKNQQMNFEQLVSVFDDTTQAIQTNQNTLFASLESLAQGISVIDKDLCLVAWNRGYLNIFNYPETLIKVGTPIENLVRFNAQRGECGFGDVESLVHKRMEHLRAGKPHKFVRQRSDGRVIEMIGNPLPHGGFVTSFNDISEHIEFQKALKEANIDLEKRVSSRADEVKAINSELLKEIERRAEVERQLVEARELAEKANASKTQFLALASHDILQPINSAKLYLSATEGMVMSVELHQTLQKLDQSLQAGENLIATLLEIARLDQGALKPKSSPQNLSKLLSGLLTEFTSMAEQKQLKLNLHCPREYWVCADPVYLHRIVRNLLSNALKYTHRGGVLLSVRRRQQQLLLQVWDTGEGISEQHQQHIFQDFYRAHDGQETGLGLGLAVVARLSKLMNMPLTLKSRVHQGSCFALLMPVAEKQAQAEHPAETSKQDIAKLTALCLDDDKHNLDAMQTLLARWQIKTQLADNFDAALLALQQQQPDVILVDYQLGESRSGLDFMRHIRSALNNQTPAILITAERDENIIQQARDLGISYLPKPVKPAKLRSLLKSFRI
ncbi:PAS domain-containing hybrid sensor histidine kinase/response regulator [Planctobacterium marinum]|uniref:PAS domain-containing hybrid sensor histidine kinase/response regulator n=1 Tax=Planctobacterium marinum TaxID=1631968 RepID=UPI001E34F71B|nr:PAS domain-containing hybrid sensor histidine kinase/response regulator [Planctobacterium marinum]MCC2604803.1 hybrid sensor histidine kinase/response regulator [Planctobacterium marinum]